MAIAATPITQGKGLLDLLRQTVPPQEQAIELYRRLLAINNLSSLMGAARNIDQLQGVLSEYFQEYFRESAHRMFQIFFSKTEQYPVNLCKYIEF